MKVDFECLRQSGNPEIWVIDDSDAHLKEFLNKSFSDIHTILDPFELSKK